MDCNNIIQRGDEAKYIIDITMDGFIQNVDYFQVRLSWGAMGQSLTITNADMFSDDEDNWYFVFDTSEMIGKVIAECTFRVPDTDCEDGYREETNRQYLCFVAPTPLPQILCVPPQQCPDTTVVYTRTFESDVMSDYNYLIDSRQRFIVDSDGNNIMVLKTAN